MISTQKLENAVKNNYVDTRSKDQKYFDTLEKGKLALESAGITIPFPQTDVHIFEDK